MASPRVVIVILNYNQLEDTLECLASLDRQKYDNAEIVLVDNASSDGSPDAVASRYPHIQILRNATNLGYAEGNNTGMRYALAQSRDYLMLLNNDTVVAPDCLAQLVAQAEREPEAAMLGPMVYHYDEPDIIQSAGGVRSARWRFYHRGQNEPDQAQYSQPEPVAWVTGCAILARSRCLGEVGLFDPRFFLYGEEVDWCLRAGEHGYKVIFVPGARVWHKGVQRRYAPSPQTTYYTARNELLLMRKHRAGTLNLVRTIARDARTLTSWTIKPRWRDKRSHRDALALGLRDFARGAFGEGSITSRADKAPPEPPPPTSPPFCRNVSRWAVRSGYPCQVLRPAMVYERVPPETVEPDVHPDFKSLYRESLPEKYVAQISNADILGWRGVIRLPDGSFPSEVTYGSTRQLKEERGYNPPLEGPTKFLEGPCFSLSFLWWKNYGHWHRDVLRQLYALLPLLPPEIRFAVPEKLAPFHYETIHAIGIRDEQLIPLAPAQPYRVETLYFTPHSEDPNEAWAWLAERITTHYGIGHALATRRIYVSRRNLPTRRILNEEECEAHLARLGFETYTPETLAHRDQVELFASADVIVGSHGAGLTNALYSPRGTRVIDILTTTFIDRFHWDMCQALGQRYLYFFGEPDAGERGAAGKDTNQIVPIEKLLRALNRMGVG